MCKKILLIVAGIFLISTLSKAESDICTAAKDSAKALFKRGEMGFYYQSKTNPNLYNFIRINQYFYQKTPIRVAPGVKDSSKLSSNKILKDAYEKSADKSQPLDTSSEYKKCYNKVFQSKLDSAFKCDFFRKADSIMMVYDKDGRGYSGVEFQGGPAALQKFFTKNLELPKDAAPDDSSKLIRVFYSFFVDEKGVISEITLTKSNCKVCEAPVLETIKKMPAFVPAKEAGKPKKVKYILPFIKAYKPKD